MVLGRRENRRKMLPVYFLIFYVCNFGCEGMMFFQRKIHNEMALWIKMFFGFIKIFFFLFSHFST